MSENKNFDLLDGTPLGEFLSRNLSIDDINEKILSIEPKNKRISKINEEPENDFEMRKSMIIGFINESLNEMCSEIVYDSLVDSHVSNL